MPWIELGLTCPTCNAKALVSLETVERHPVCPHCGKDIPSVEVYRLSGFVYILSNPSMPGLLKIGYTERDVMERAAEISAATGVPEPYVVEAFFASANPAADEEQVHRLLGDFRGTRKEFFRVDLQPALDAVYEVCGSRPRYCRAGLDYETPDERAARRAAELAEQRAREEAERRAREETERRAREDAAQRAREAAERQARAEAARRAKAAERRVREDAARRDNSSAGGGWLHKAEQRVRDGAAGRAHESGERRTQCQKCGTILPYPNAFITLICANCGSTISPSKSPQRR